MIELGIVNKVLYLAQLLPDKEILVDAARKMTYKELHEQIMQNVEKINCHTSDADLPIGLLFPNSIEFIVWILAAEYCGKPVVLFSNKMKLGEIEYHLERISIDFLVTDEKHTLDEKSDYRLLEKNKYCKLLAPICTTKEQNCFEKGDYLCHFTSGSEGEVKAVIRTKDGIENEIVRTAETIEFGTDKVFLTVPPICHSFGLIAGTLLPLYYGHKLVLADQFQPENIAYILDKEKVNILFAVPYMYYLLDAHMEKAAYNSFCLEYCFSAGAPLEKDISNFFKVFVNAKLIQDYGSTETGVICLNSSIERRAKSVGKPVGGRSITFFDQYVDNGITIGEIGVKSTDIIRKYIYPEKYNTQKFEDGFFKTGDLGYIDEDGFLHIVGRTNLIINVAGNKVDPIEVENTILKMEGIREAVVVGKTHDRIGKILVAFVVKSQNNISELDIRKHCQKKLADYKVPRNVYFMEELPKGHTGKVLRKKVEDTLC